MADAAAIASKEEAKDQKNPFSVFGSFFKFPFHKAEPPKSEEVGPRGEERSESTSERPSVVRYRQKAPEVPPPLKLEAEEEPGKTSNPLILWQVYALGGFLVLRWVWGRWQERNARKGGDDDASDEFHPATDGPADDDSSFR